MNIYDISKRAGVSIATVSRVLNNSLHVSEKTRQHVLSVIEEAGYIPNAFARGLGLNTMKTIGLVCPDASDPYLARAVSMLEHAFRQHHYDSLLICTGEDYTSRDGGIAALVRRHVDGIILMGSSFVSQNPSENGMILDTSESIPTAILNGSLPGEHIYSVLCDDMGATSMAADLLCREGRKKPIYLYHALSASGMKKLQGFREAVNRNRLSVGREFEIMVGKESRSIPAVCQMLVSAWNHGIHFDSVITSEDMLAIGALKAVRRLGLRVPEDISILGYNNSDLCLCTEPELSSIDTCLPLICDHIVQTLVSVLEGTEMPHQQVFNAHIVERESTLFKVQHKNGKENDV